MLITEASGAILWKLSVPTHGAVEGRRLGRVSLCRCVSGRCSWRAGCCFGGLIPRRLACGYLHVVVLSETACVTRSAAVSFGEKTRREERGKRREERGQRGGIRWWKKGSASHLESHCAIQPVGKSGTWLSSGPASGLAGPAIDTGLLVLCRPGPRSANGGLD